MVLHVRIVTVLQFCLMYHIFLNKSTRHGQLIWECIPIVSFDLTFMHHALYASSDSVYCLSTDG